MNPVVVACVMALTNLVFVLPVMRLMNSGFKFESLWCFGVFVCSLMYHIGSSDSDASNTLLVLMNKFDRFFACTSIPIFITTIMWSNSFDVLNLRKLPFGPYNKMYTLTWCFNFIYIICNLLIVVFLDVAPYVLEIVSLVETIIMVMYQAIKIRSENPKSKPWKTNVILFVVLAVIALLHYYIEVIYKCDHGSFVCVVTHGLWHVFVASCLYLGIPG